MYICIGQTCYGHFEFYYYFVEKRMSQQIKPNGERGSCENYEMAGTKQRDCGNYRDGSTSSNCQVYPGEVTTQRDQALLRRMACGKRYCVLEKKKYYSVL